MFVKRGLRKIQNKKSKYKKKNKSKESTEVCFKK